MYLVVFWACVSFGVLSSGGGINPFMGNQKIRTCVAHLVAAVGFCLYLLFELFVARVVRKAYPHAPRLVREEIEDEEFMSTVN